MVAPCKPFTEVREVCRTSSRTIVDRAAGLRTCDALRGRLVTRPQAYVRSLVIGLSALGGAFTGALSASQIRSSCFKVTRMSRLFPLGGARFCVRVRAGGSQLFEFVQL